MSTLFAFSKATALEAQHQILWTTTTQAVLTVSGLVFDVVGAALIWHFGLRHVSTSRLRRKIHNRAAPLLSRGSVSANSSPCSITSLRDRAPLGLNVLHRLLGNVRRYHYRQAFDDEFNLGPRHRVFVFHPVNRFY